MRQDPEGLAVFNFFPTRLRLGCATSVRNRYPQGPQGASSPEHPKIAASTATSSRSPLLCSSLCFQAAIHSDSPFCKVLSHLAKISLALERGPATSGAPAVCLCRSALGQLQNSMQQISDFKFYKRVGFASHGPTWPCCRPCTLSCQQKFIQSSRLQISLERQNFVVDIRRGLCGYCLSASTPAHVGKVIALKAVLEQQLLKLLWRQLLGRSSATLIL